MLSQWLKPARWWSLLAGAGLLLAAVAPAQAQILPSRQSSCCDSGPTFTWPWRKSCCEPCQGCQTVVVSPTTPGMPPETMPPTAADPTLPTERFAALGGEGFAVTSSAVGYVDSAIPGTQMRIRIDSAFDNVRPDRAEFFYAKCGCAPDGPGPLAIETAVDYQEVNFYFELATSPCASFFVELPWRFLDPEQNPNENDFGDMIVGFKYAAIREADLVGTFQFKWYFPTGNARFGTGTAHDSMELGWLVHRNLGGDWTLEAEIRDWIAMGGTDFAGNVLRTGVGVSYLAWTNGCNTIRPVIELVGWTIIDGKEFVVAAPVAAGVVEKDSDGEFIANAKVGARYGFDRGDVYLGYGRALTGDTWYQDVIRFEFRLAY